MIVGHIKSPQDLQSKKTLQSQLLDLEVSNEAEQERRVKDYKNPNRPIPIAPEYKTNAELQKDRLGQEKQAISNMEELGFDYTKSAELIAWLSSSLINRLVEFNANFKGIKKELTETTNPKLLNSEYLKNYLEKYFEDIDINFGRKFGKEAISSSATPSTATLDELDEILPEIRTIDEIRDKVVAILRDVGAQLRPEREKAGVYKRNIRELEEENAQLGLIDRSRLTERGRRDYIEDEKKNERQIRDLRRDEGMMIELMPKLRTITALLKLYSAVVPSRQTLNLLKQSLTQKERGDVVRRYMVILHQSNFLSRSGADELADEINEITVRIVNEGTVPFLQEISRWTNKTLKALSFVSNEAGINKITKLQRDYEVLLNQSGKIGEYEQLKQYTNIMEKEIADAFVEMRMAMEEPAIEMEDFLINPATNYIRRDTPLTRAVKDSEERDAEAELIYEDELRGLEERETTLLNVFKDPRYPNMSAENKEELLQDLQNTRSEIKKLKGAKDDYIQISKTQNRERGEYNLAKEKYAADKMTIDAAKAGKEQLNKFFEKFDFDARQNIKPIRPDVRPMEAPRYNEQQRTMTNLHRKFKAELKQLYEENPANTITTVRHFLRDRGYGEKKTQRQKRTDDEWFRSLIFKVDAVGRDKIKELEGQMGLNFADYDAIEGMETAKRYNRKGDVLGDTMYGIGLSKKLAKHFREDEKEISQMRADATLMAKELKRHKKAEKVLSSEDEGKGRCGLGFRHTKVSLSGKKVGKGISVSDTPTYLSFGKYVIHMGHLLDKNVANFKYPSLGSIPSIKPFTIGEDYKDFILDTLDNQKPNERLFNKLTQEEQRHFERVVSGAGLVDVFKLKRTRTAQEKNDTERFELLRGEVMAGNNSEKVLKELRGLIVRFINEGRIHQREGTTMLMEISEL
jgi:hypothetical protein